MVGRAYLPNQRPRSPIAVGFIAVFLVTGQHGGSLDHARPMCITLAFPLCDAAFLLKLHNYIFFTHKTVLLKFGIARN